MRYRKLDESGDMVFGHGATDYLADTPEAVGQAVITRLKLMTGEWFLDIDEGTNYENKILGVRTVTTRDAEIRARILGTQGVKEMTEYSSSVDVDTRMFSVTATINTIYGETIISEVL